MLHNNCTKPWAAEVLTTFSTTVYPATKFSTTAIAFLCPCFYFRSMHIEIIQCPEEGTVYKRKDGLRITIGTHITLFFEDDVKLVLNIKTSLGNLSFPIPDNEDLRWLVSVILEGKFKHRPSTYEYVEAKLLKAEREYKAFLPWYKDEY